MAPLVLLDGLPDEGQALLVGLGDGGSLVGAKFVRAETGSPHVPVAL